MDELQIIDENEIQQAKPARPTIITALCVLGFIGLLVTIPLIFSDMASSIGSWYPPYLAFSALLGGICMIGLWKMKAWGVYTYAGLLIVNQIALALLGLWTWPGLIIPAIVVGIGIYYLKDMS
ncbi:MAG: hypothetical protein WED33_06015 [Bacteroidia bacterium]